MQDVEKQCQLQVLVVKNFRFEQLRLNSVEDTEEIEKLTTWYEYFLKSYNALEVEVAKRRQFEIQMQEKAKLMTQFFEQEYAKETQRRMEFNDQNYRYLPSNLKFLLEDPPIKFSIFPKHLLVENLKES